MNRIKQTREEKGLSQQAVANQLNTSRQAISLYEHGDREPKLATWEALSKLLGVNVDYLQGRSEYKTKQEVLDSIAYRNEEGHLVFNTKYIPYRDIEQGINKIIEGTKKARELHDSLNDDYQTYSAEFIKLLNSVIELNGIKSISSKHFEALNQFISKLSNENLSNKQIEEAIQVLKVALTKIEK